LAGVGLDGQQVCRLALGRRGQAHRVAVLHDQLDGRERAILRRSRQEIDHEVPSLRA
jgi:hypothetical protein